MVLKYKFYWSFVFDKLCIRIVVEFTDFKWEEVRICIVKIYFKVGGT